MSEAIKALTVIIILHVCDRNGSHRFSRSQVMEELTRRALKPDSGIENIDSAVETASYELTWLTKTSLIKRIGHGEYEWWSQEYLNAWISVMKTHSED